MEELLRVRHSDLKMHSIDPYDESSSSKIPSMDELIDPSSPNTTNALFVHSGPDSNGKNILFVALQHKHANECCVSALSDLLIYEAHCGREEEVGPKTAPGWIRDPELEAPLLFHEPGLPQTPLSLTDVSQAIRDALSAVGAPAFEDPDILIHSAAKRCVLQGGDRHEACDRILAPPPPAHLSRAGLRQHEAVKYLEALKELSAIFCQTAAWKLQTFDTQWPLASLEIVRKREFYKFFRRSLRRVNGLSGCAKCSSHDNLKICVQCNTTWYCSRDCQRKHWKTHKPDCKKLLANI